MPWDVFISHASEDKDTVARPLANILIKAGLRVWIDENELKLGDSLREKIDHGLASSHFGIVILSPAFFAKTWPNQELSALFSRERKSKRLILPIWHEIDQESVAQYSPLLADRIAVSTKRGLERVASEVLGVVSSQGALESPTISTAATSTIDNPGPPDPMNPLPSHPESTKSNTQQSASLDHPVHVAAPGFDVWEQMDVGPTVFSPKGISVVHTACVRGVATSPDGKRVVSGGKDGRLLFWEIPSGKCLASIETDEVLTVEWSHNGRFLVSGHQRCLRFWSARTGKRGFEIDIGFISTLSHRLRIALSPDGRFVAANSDFSRIKIFDLRSRELLRTCEGRGRVNSVSWSPDGSRLLSGDDENHVRLWNPETGECPRVLDDGHEWGVWSVAWSPDSRHAISGDGRNNIKIWDLNGGRCVHALKGHSYQVYEVTWNPGPHPVSADGGA